MARHSPATNVPLIFPKWMRRISPARRAALLCLSEVIDKGREAQAALNALPGLLELNATDRSLCTELVYGYCRLEGRLTGLAGFFLKKPEDLPLPIRRLITLAALELTTLTRIPDYASVNWAVDAARAGFGANLAGLVNAVLRNICRLGADAANPAFFAEKLKDQNRFLRVWYSQPRWIIEHFLKNYPEERALGFFETFAATPTAGLRVNISRPGAKDLITAFSQTATMRLGPALAFMPRDVPKVINEEPLETLLADGRISRQGFGAQEALLQLLNAGLCGPVWDACCGRGNKSCMLLERGVLVPCASDPNAQRLFGFKKELARLKLPAPLLFRADASMPPLQHAPKTILADVPCSGLGTLARRPDIKYHRSFEDLAQLSQLQERIANALARMLKPCGKLAWLTCTLNPNENELQTRAMSTAYGLELEYEFTTSPGSSGSEFFYAALLQKKG